MAGASLIPSGDFRTSYAADTTIFPSRTSRNAAIACVILLCFAPQIFSACWLSISIQIGIFAIAALGLNILVGFTGQISIGHAAFFLLGAFTSAYISNNAPIPVFFAIPLAGVITALVGLIFGVPAARLKGLYLVIATLAAQYILLDFFSRADWFSGGSVPASANPFSIFGYTFRGDHQYFYVVLLPESMEWISAGLKGSAIDKALSLNTNITFLREIAIGLIIIAFLMFEPDGLAHRWRQIKTYWKLYPFSH